VTPQNVRPQDLTLFFIRDAERILGLAPSGLRYKEDSETGYLHNVILGAVVLSHYEEMFDSRGAGILAYNHGPGNVRRAMKRAGLGTTSHRTISEFRGTVPDRLKNGGRPRVYLDRVLAGAVMVRRARLGMALEPIDTLTLEDIPGAHPKEDGADFIP